MSDINNKYYSTHAPGRIDYWKKMAAPRFRSKTIRQCLAALNFSSLVDLGCGSGLLLDDVSKEFPNSQYCGIDFSSQQIEQNKRNFPQFDWGLFNLAEEKPVPTEFQNKFDVALCSEVIEHIDYPERLLTHARSFTKLGSGLLILTTQSGTIRETERRVGHLQHFPREKLLNLLENTGWNVRKIWNAGFPFHDLSKWMANRNPDRTMVQFSENAYGLWESTVCWALRLAFLLNSDKRGAQLFAIAQQK